MALLVKPAAIIAAARALANHVHAPAPT